MVRITRSIGIATRTEVCHFSHMLRALLYIFGGLFTAYGLFGMIVMIYWGFSQGSVEPNFQALDDFILKNMSEEIADASVALFMGLVLLALERLIKLFGE